MADQNQERPVTDDATVPAELVEALQSDAVAMDLFEKLASSHRREYMRWVGEAKKVETRQARAAKALEMIRTKKLSKD